MTGGEGGRSESVLATVSTEASTALLTSGGTVTFGRSTESDVRIGAWPVYDGMVPRRAGRVVDVRGRVAIENVDDTLALDVWVRGRPLISIPPGDLHGPSERAFDVLVTGAVTTYQLTVMVNVDGTKTRRLPADAPAGDADPPTGPPPDLTPRQRDVLDAYVAPLAKGGLVATHQHVADALGLSRSLVRLECQAIWSAMFLAGIPMRDLGDARDEVVDAWGRHRM